MVKCFSVVVDIPAAPGRVWAVMTDIEHWPEWTPTVTSIELLDPGPLKGVSRRRLNERHLALEAKGLSERCAGTPGDTMGRS